MIGTHLVVIAFIDLVVGASTGWFMARLAGTRGTDFWSCVALGILGALIAPVIFQMLGSQPASILGCVAQAILGATIVLTISRQFSA